MMDEFEMQSAAIELCRKINRKAADQYAHRGIAPIDISIAGMLSAYDIALAVHGHPQGAMEWMRTAVDTIERQMREDGHGVQ